MRLVAVDMHEYVLGDVNMREYVLGDVNMREYVLGGGGYARICAW